MLQTLLRFYRNIVHSPAGVARVIVLLVVVLLYGTTGFMYFEIEAKPQLTWPDAAWWSVVTVTTVGYGDFFPTTFGGRFVVAAPLMFFGMGLLGYVVSIATSALVAARSKELRGMGTVKHEKHVVIFHYPGLAKVERVVDELRQDKEFGTAHPLVLVDEHLPELPIELADRGLSFVRGDPTRDETLARANVDLASHAIVLAKNPSDPHSDALSLLVTLAIEARSKNVRTTVECVETKSHELLKKAGCDSIVCVARFDAHFIGGEVLHPGMQTVIDMLLSAKGNNPQIHISDLPPSAKTFADVSARCREKGHIPLGVLRDGAPILNAPADLGVRATDRVVSVGTQRLPSGS